MERAAPLAIRGTKPNARLCSQENEQTVYVHVDFMLRKLQKKKMNLQMADRIKQESPRK